MLVSINITLKRALKRLSSLVLHYLTIHPLSTRYASKQLLRVNVVRLCCILHTVRSHPCRFLSIKVSLRSKTTGLPNLLIWWDKVFISSKEQTSGTKRENPNLISSRTCSITRIAASPGSILHFPSRSYRHTRSTELVHMDITMRNCRFANVEVLG